MSADLWKQRVAQALEGRRRGNLYRQRPVVEALDAGHVRMGERVCTNFAGNNYLGLTHHPAVIAAVQESAGHYGAGSGAAALISGYQASHAQAEAALARWKDCAAAVLFPSGYQANQAAIQTLAGVGAKVRFLVDKLAHASLIEAIQGSGKAYRVFPHNHLAKLQRLLTEHEAEQLQVVVTESVFSMDGDAADLAGLAQLKAEHPFVLLLDEAHASGVYGPAGSGYAAELGLGGIVDLSVVTFSKALGCAGGAVCGEADDMAAVVNLAPAAIFSTSVPPMIPSAVLAALEVMKREPQRQQRVRALARRVRTEVARMRLPVPEGDSPIIPVILGTEQRALEAAGHLRQRGLLVAAVRPPTVPRGQSRLRITLSCEHSDAEIDNLLQAMEELTEPEKHEKKAGPTAGPA